ncbi:MAG: lamin tail domain-containing protein [Chloroflexi bacterium]|nr:lamin tail domain-containing protein [Chloroflexota bacterium]
MQNGNRSTVNLPGWALTVIIAVLILILVAAVAGIAALVNLMAQAGAFPPQTPVVVPVTPPAEPYIRLTPSRGVPGTLVTVTGYDWQPGDAVTLYLDDPTNPAGPRARLGTTTVRGDGGFVVAINIPNYAPWSELEAVLVTAESPASGHTASAGFLLVQATGQPTAVPPTDTPLPGVTPTETPLPTNTPTVPSPTPVTPSVTPFIPSPMPLPPTATPVPFMPTNTPLPTPTPTATPIITDWRGEYYGNTQLAGAPVVVRNDIGVNYNWGGSSPAPGLPVDQFSVRWTRTLFFEAGNYRFHALVDDGVRVWVDNILVIDSWAIGSQREVTGDIHLTAGFHAVRIEYFEYLGEALIRVWWDMIAEFLEWRGEYFNNRFLSGNPVLVRNDSDIRLSWGNGSPAPQVPADDFSVRWTRSFYFEEGTYAFSVNVDDGVRLFIDTNLIIDRWSDGPHQVTANYFMTTGFHPLRVEYFEHLGEARIDLSWQRITAFPDWKGEYFDNRDVAGSPILVRNDREILFNWGEGSPAPQMPADNFSVRWSRRTHFDQGTYRFHATVDDGVRLWVDGYRVLDEWESGPPREVTADFALPAGQHDLRIDYFEAGGGALIHVWWERITSPTFAYWKGEYFTNRDLAGSPVLVRDDHKIDFDWGDGAPQVGLPKDSFSVRWSRWADFQAGIYRFRAQADDGIRFFIDGQSLLNEWHTSSGEQIYTVELSLAGAHWLVVEYYEAGGSARVRFFWERLGPIPTATFTPTNTPTPTRTPTQTPPAPPTPPAPNTVVINEVLPNPQVVDWNGDGWVTPDDQWIELYNRGIEAVNIGGWFLDDGPAGSLPYHIPAGTVLRRGEFLVLYRRDTGVPLSELGGTVRLLDPGGHLVHQMWYPPLGPDASYSRGLENQWFGDWPPSPGRVNLPKRLLPRLGRGEVE